MKKIFLILLCVILSMQSLIAEDNDEFRAFWVITWEYISGSQSPGATRARIREILNNVAAANMNAVLWQVRQSGTAYYSSSFEPWGYYSGYSYPGFDPLAYAVQEAHSRGIEIHAWMNTFEAASTHAGAPAVEHPDWVCRDQSGIPMSSSRALSPGLAEVRHYLRNVAMEVVNNYDIDGLHLDYVRWNEYSNSKVSQDLAKQAEESLRPDGMIPEELAKDMEINKAGRYLYDAQHPFSSGIPDSVGGGQFPSWEAWWRWDVTDLVHSIHDSIQAVKPWVRLSVAALGKYNWTSWQGYGYVYQDAALWFNQGYIDQLTPMHYHWTTPSGFYSMLTGGCPQCWGQYIQPGLNDGRLFSVGPGSYIFDDLNVWGNHVSVVNKVRTVSWVDGFQFFSYGQWEDYLYFPIAREKFFQRKTKIRDTGLIDNSVPEAPSLSINKIDSLNYEITVIPANSQTENQWFVFYKSEDGQLDQDADEIVRIKFGNAPITITDSYDGTQDYNGSYHYAASSLDRFWNESAGSNIEVSDPIPSFAPKVVSTDPAEADSISVHETVQIDFSKRINAETIVNATMLTPAAGELTFSWNSDSNSVIISFGELLLFNTFYTLNIDSSLTDVNGRLLDGNGDGTEGDSFDLNFKAKAIDDVPPQILWSFPAADGTNDSVDVRDIAVVEFNELLDETTITETTVSIFQSANRINSAFTHDIVNDRSVISIQPVWELLQNESYTLYLNSIIADTAGNPMGSVFTANYGSSALGYETVDIIDDFTLPGSWWQPSGSGSTEGVIVSQTTWGYVSDHYLPATTPKKSARLKYLWDNTAGSWLLREYIPNSDPIVPVFDTTFTLQAYVFGDGSLNKFRFAVDEGDGSSWPNHEVSAWTTIDWVGWKLVEWKLSDPNSLGSWIGNGVMDMSHYRIDSFQMTWDPDSGAVQGEIYIDDFRLIKKTRSITGVSVDNENIPLQFELQQNYPNPFNPTTTISFSLEKPRRTSLVIYDILGREVLRIFDANLQAGSYSYTIDASAWASGEYIYALRSGERREVKRMMLIK